MTTTIDDHDDEFVEVLRDFGKTPSRTDVDEETTVSGWLRNSVRDTRHQTRAKLQR